MIVKPKNGYAFVKKIDVLHSIVLFAGRRAGSVSLRSMDDG